jgi:hypothetical protein
MKNKMEDIYNMKRIFAMILILTIFVLVLSSCNMSCGFGSYTFKHLHCISYGENVCLNISKWHDNSTGIEVKAHDGTSYFFSEGTYILIENQNKCPFCSPLYNGGY